MTSRPLFHKKRIFPLLVVMIGLAFSLFFLAPVLRQLVVPVLYPFQFAAVTVWQGLGGLPATLINLKRLSQENVELKIKLNELRFRLTLLDELKAENERLRGALNFKASGRFARRLLPARVVGRSATPAQAVLVIDQGSASGVRLKAPIVVKEGLVGQIIEIAQFSSKVLLIIDPFSSVAAVDQRSRVFGVAEGNAADWLAVKYVRAGADVQAGDLIVTSAISSFFPPGIPIGEVISTAKKDSDLFSEIKVRPVVDFSKLEEVFVGL